MTRLNNKVAIITGAGSGIGKASAIMFAKEGANVIVTDINEESANNVSEYINQQGGNSIALHVDVSQEKQLQEMIDTTIKHFEKIDILFNNATNTDPEMSKKDSSFFT